MANEPTNQNQGTPPANAAAAAAAAAAGENKPAGDGAGQKPAADGGGQPQMHKVKVDGQERLITLEEALKGYEKSSGAEKRMQEAAEARKEAAEQAKQAREGLRFMELLKKVQDADTPDEKDLKELAEISGVDANDMIAAAGIKIKGEPPAKKEPVKMTDLDPDLQLAMTRAKEEAYSQAVTQVKDELGEDIDRDPMLGKILKETAEKDRAAVRSALIDDAYGDLYGRLRDGKEYGPELRSLTVQRLRNLVAKIGKPAIDGQLKMQQDDTLLRSLGLVPSGMPAMATEIQAEKPIERVSITDEKYLENATARFLQRQLKDLRARVGR